MEGDERGEEIERDEREGKETGCVLACQGSNMFITKIKRSTGKVV